MSDQIRKYACLLINMPPKVTNAVKEFQKTIDPVDLFPEEADGGIEDHIHITLMYGLEDSLKPMLYKALEAVRPFTVQLGDITLFDTSPKHDVVKFDIVDCETLCNISNAIRTIYPNFNKYPEYKPHCTISYCMKGAGQKYVDQPNDATGRIVTVKHIIWSATDGTKSTIYLKE